MAQVLEGRVRLSWGWCRVLMMTNPGGTGRFLIWPPGYFRLQLLSVHLIAPLIGPSKLHLDQTNKTRGLSAKSRHCNRTYVYTYKDHKYC